MLTAGIVSLLFKLFRQPVVLGYIVAGMFAGPYVCGASWISDAESVETWGQIGVLFLLFAMGLEFSFKKLIAMGSTALISAATIVIGMMSVGFLAGRLMGWNEINSLFLGGMLCMSSTTIVFKAIEDMGLSSYKFASVAMGILIVEDLFAVVLMVLLSSIAVNQNFAGEELAMEIVKLIAYLVLWFVLGIYILPTFFRKFKTHLNDETLTIFAIGLCLGMVLLATEAGFSSALGAFVMGSILAETLEAERIEHLVQPIKNVFGSIFFVSVGMMLNPQMLADYWLPILIITLLVIFGQIFFASLGTLLSGQTLKVSLQTGFSLVQIGEFAFIIAGFGQSAGVTDSSLYPIVVAVSVITTFTTPYMIKLARPTYSLLCKKMPKGMLKRLETNKDEGSRSMKEKSEWQKLLRLYALRVVLYGVILIALFIGSSVFLSPMLSSALAEKVSEPMLHVITLAITLGIMTPFLFGIAVSTGDMNHITSKLYKEKKNRIPLIGLVLLRIFIALGFIMAVIAKNVNLEGWALLLILTSAVIFLLIARFSVHKFSFIEKKFIANLNEREEAERKAKPVTTSIRNKLSGYDVHLEKIKISPDSLFVGQTFQDISFRKKTGANIIKLTRGSHHIIIPSSSTILYPHDELIAVGTTEQIQSFREMITSSTEVLAHEKESEFIVHTITLEEDSFLTGKTVRQPQMKRQRCMIISVLRGEDFITNPDPDFVFAVGDIVWLAGEKSAVQSY